MIFFWVDRSRIYDDESAIYKRWDYKLHDRFGDWLAETWVNDLCNWIHKKKDRKVRVKLDPYDTWSMDNTLAYIILPMLKQLRDKKHGSPHVDADDLPAHLRLSKRETKVNENGHWDKKLKASEAEQKAADEKFHGGWDWVLGEMIFAFESQFNDWEDQFAKGEHDILWQKVDVKGNPISDPEPMRKRDRDEDGNANFLYQMTKGPKDTYEIDWVGRKAYGDRIANGYRLFGKYYQALWD
jgi:hypothetical protein